MLRRGAAVWGCCSVEESGEAALVTRDPPRRGVQMPRSRPRAEAQAAGRRSGGWAAVLARMLKAKEPQTATKRAWGRRGGEAWMGGKRRGCFVRAAKRARRAGAHHGRCGRRLQRAKAADDAVMGRQKSQRRAAHYRPAQRGALDARADALVPWISRDSESALLRGRATGASRSQRRTLETGGLDFTSLLPLREYRRSSMSL